jgi:hypothetical protein
MRAANSRYETRVSSRHEEHSIVQLMGLRSVAEYSACLPVGFDLVVTA